MKNVVYSFCREFGFPDEATASLTRDCEAMMAVDGADELVAKYLDKYDKENRCDYFGALEEAKPIFSAAKVHPYSAAMVFSILFTPLYHKKLQERGYSEEIWRDSMDDLLSKAYECYDYCGVWGSFVASWFSLFFNFSLFGLGRLEFRLLHFEGEFEKDGNVIHDGDLVIDVHIPSKGKLPHDAVVDSYRKACAFFADRIKARPFPIVCESWMLWPKHYDILPENSNLIAFQRDYTVYKTVVDEDGGDLWRIFGKEYGKDTSKMPKNTTLQKEYAALLDRGEDVGYAFGAFFFDGENFV